MLYQSPQSLSLDNRRNLNSRVFSQNLHRLKIKFLNLSHMLKRDNSKFLRPITDHLLNPRLVVLHHLFRLKTKESVNQVILPRILWLIHKFQSIFNNKLLE